MVECARQFKTAATLSKNIDRFTQGRERLVVFLPRGPYLSLHTTCKRQIVRRFGKPSDGDGVVDESLSLMELSTRKQSLGCARHDEISRHPVLGVANQWQVLSIPPDG